jgi:PrtD family type I secretion system ABC transporter
MIGVLERTSEVTVAGAGNRWKMLMRRPTQRPNPTQKSELAQALASCRGAFVATGLMSGMSNILMLTGAIFMLEIYDRVLPSRSIPTLVALVILAAGLFTAQGLLDLIRQRVLVRIGGRLDEELSSRVYETIVRLPLKAGYRVDGSQPLRDLDSIRSFLSGVGPTALFDLPWLPVYLAICFAFHPYIGLAALAGAIILACLTAMTEVLTREPTKAATRHAAARSNLAEASRRNAEALKSMGMVPRIAMLWHDANSKYMASQQRAADVAGGFGSASKALRMMLQSGVLAVGAYLVINQQATAGIIIAGSILSARALAPVDLAIANWKGFVAARQSWQRLTRLLAALPSVPEPMALQPPKKALQVENATVAPPGSDRIVVQDVSFSLQSGHGLGIIGPSGSGKSSLARLLIGVWEPLRGRIRLDGAALEQWPADTLGACVGYLPQDVELFTGTVAENIARFATPLDAESVIKAAQAAGVHELIVNLPDGYETQVGEGGTSLSAGQAQRVALARALYGDPFLVVLDEPNSNLDADGDEALSRAIMGVRARGGIVVVVAHRPSAIMSVDQLLMMHQGKVQAFGPKEEVLARVMQRDSARPLKVVPDTGLAKS